MPELHNRRTSQTVWVTSFCGGLTLTLILAAGTASALEPADQSGGELQEILVTATRREESLSKVPISITAMTQDTLDKLGVKDFSDMVRFTPGVSLNTVEGNNVTIRGIGASGGASTTGIYIDDAPIQNRALILASQTLPKTFDVERVEVLRGPQGTLFGAGSEGGTVRYIMTQPSTTTSSSYARSEVAYTEGGAPSYEAGVAAGGPVIDGAFGMRASAWYRKDGGWIDQVNPFTGSPEHSNANSGQSTAFRLSALWQPTSAIAITPALMYQDRRTYNNGEGGSYWDFLSSSGSDKFVTASPDRASEDDSFTLATLKFAVDFQRSQLISNTSYYKRDDSNLNDGAYGGGTIYNLAYYQTLGWLPDSGTGAVGSFPYAPYAGTLCPTMSACYPLVDANGVHLPAGVQNYRATQLVRSTQENWTQELRLQSTDPSEKVRWTVGAFYTVNHSTQFNPIYDPDVDQLFAGLFGQTLGAVYGQPLNPDGSTYLPGGTSFYSTQSAYDRQLAGFGEAEWPLTDRLKLTTGLRFTHSSFSFAQSADGPLNFGPSSTAGDQSKDNTTVRVGLSFQADPSNLYYVTYSTGFRPGGANAPIPAAVCAVDFETFGISGTPTNYNSDTVKSFEVGAKNTIAERVKLSTSAYYIHWDSIQQNVLLPTCGLDYVANLGRVTSKGFDFAGDFLVTDTFSVQTAVGYTDAVYTENVFPGADATAPIVADGNAVSTGVLAGANTPISPWTVSVGAEYRFKAYSHQAYARADYEYASQNRALTAAEDPRTVQYDPYLTTPPSRTFVSLRSGIKIGDWDVSGFIDNLFDSHTILSTLHSNPDGSGPQSPVSPLFAQIASRPRTFGITAVFRR
jgi:iron complex outermembrane recepter protein